MNNGKYLKELSMHISIINDIEQFEKLRDVWNTIHSTDPHTTVFVSWEWIRGWIDTKVYDWSVIAIQPNSHSPYIAFMPVGTRYFRRGRFNSLRKLVIGGDPWSDNTGFICLPEYTEKVIPALVTFIQKYISWNLFDMRNVYDPRLGPFLQCFPQRKFEIREIHTTSCPYINLPDTWDQYLKEFLSPNTRKNLKYYTGKIERLKEFRVTHVQTGNLDIQIETLLSLWQERWGKKSEDILNSYRAIFRHCFENNSLFLTILWDGTVPISGEAAFLDRIKKTITSYTKAFNNVFADFRPGNVMTGYIIRYAIENGFKIYDFGAGNENYKFIFGTVERFNRNVSIVPRTMFRKLKNKVPGKLKSMGKSLLS